MDTLVVQIGTRHARVAELTRSREGRLTIGRGFDNDLVLTDIHVAPQQLAFWYDEGQWTLTVLDQTNPVLLNGIPVTGGSHAVASGDQLIVGRTRLALFSEDDPVEPTRKLMLSNWFSGHAINPLLPVLLLLFACLLDFMLVYFESSISLEWQSVASDELVAAVLIVVWAGLWAFVGRLLRHQHHYGLQLVVSVLVLLFASVSLLAAEYLAYPFHSLLVSDMSAWFVLYTSVFLLIRFNLAIASNLHRPGWVASFLTVVVASVVYGFSYFDDNDSYRYMPNYSTELKPPVLGVYKGISSADYFSQVSEMMQRLEEEREKAL